MHSAGSVVCSQIFSTTGGLARAAVDYVSKAVTQRITRLPQPLRLPLAATAVCASVFALTRQRWLPSVALRTMFCVNLGWTMSLANLQIIYLQSLKRLGLLSAANTAGLCAATTAWWCRVHRILSPHVHITTLPGSLQGGIAALPRPHVVLLNHTSFFDVVLFLWNIQPSYMRVMKTFYKIQLTKVPLLGRILTSSEMLPVYFVRDHHEEFRVERDKQEAVLVATNAHLNSGGCISFFPEGGINHRDVRQLLPFRHGTFQRAIEHRLELYYMLHVGGNAVWPVTGCALGGYPVDVYLYYGKIDVDYNDPTLDAKKVAELCQAEMQKRLDWMYEIADGKASKNAK